MNKLDVAVLEKIFEHDVESAISGRGWGPMQFRSSNKRVKRLERDGYVRKVTVQIGQRPVVTITGYELTPVGHLTYCTSCALPPKSGGQ